MLPGAVATLQHNIALGERRAVEAGEHKLKVGRYPLAAEQIALRSCQDRLVQDGWARNIAPTWAAMFIDGDLVAPLRPAWLVSYRTTNLPDWSSIGPSGSARSTIRPPSVAGDIYFMRVTADAGALKAGGYRDEQLHQQLIDLGFLNVVRASRSGPLFYRTAKGRDGVKASGMVSGRVSSWPQSSK